MNTACSGKSKHDLPLIACQAQMETYCSALLNQEKSLEELQRHLRTTEV